jgi:thioredoxin reductase (NADPH)
MRQQVADLGVRIIEADAIAMILGMTPKGITTRSKLIYAKAVIIATGRGLKSGLIANEDELLGRGVSYCALCDGPLFREKDVIVYGNDEETIDDALTLSQMTCNVTLVCEKSLEDLNPARAEELRSSPHPINFIENAKVTEILKAEHGNVAGAKVILSDQTEQKIPAKAVFIISRVKSRTLLTQAGITMDGDGLIPTDAQQRTNLDGVFAAGDVTNKEKQVSIAVGQGALAGIEAARYIREL